MPRTRCGKNFKYRRRVTSRQKLVQRFIRDATLLVRRHKLCPFLAFPRAPLSYGSNTKFPTHSERGARQQANPRIGWNGKGTPDATLLQLHQQYQMRYSGTMTPHDAIVMVDWKRK